MCLYRGLGTVGVEAISPPRPAGRPRCTQVINRKVDSRFNSKKNPFGCVFSFRAIERAEKITRFCTCIQTATRVQPCTRHPLTPGVGNLFVRDVCQHRRDATSAVDDAFISDVFHRHVKLSSARL